MSTQLHSQAPLQEGVGELDAQVGSSIRAALTLAVLMLKERLGYFPVGRAAGGRRGRRLPAEGLEQLGNVGLYC